MHRILILAAALVALTLTPTFVLAAGDAATGKTLYDTNCMSCHGATGKGDGPVGANLPVSPRDFSKGEFKLNGNGDGSAGTDESLAAVIKNGAAKFGGSPLMAPWGQFSDDDIANLIAYIRSLKE